MINGPNGYKNLGFLMYLITSIQKQIFLAIDVSLQPEGILNQCCSDNSRHIILCGYITKQSVETFLRDFLHKDRSETAVNVVIMAK